MRQLLCDPNCCRLMTSGAMATCPSCLSHALKTNAPPPPRPPDPALSHSLRPCDADVLIRLLLELWLRGSRLRRQTWRSAWGTCARALWHCCEAQKPVSGLCGLSEHTSPETPPAKSQRSFGGKSHFSCQSSRSLSPQAPSRHCPSQPRPTSWPEGGP